MENKGNGRTIAIAAVVAVVVAVCAFLAGSSFGASGAKAERQAERDLDVLLPSMLPSADVEMAFAQVNVFHDDVDTTYLVPSGETAKEVIEAAFGDQAAWNGTAFVFEPGVSRKQVLVPAISEALAAHPHE